MESRWDTGSGGGILDDVSTDGVGDGRDEEGVAVWLRRGKIPSGRRGSRCSCGERSGKHGECGSGVLCLLRRGIAGERDGRDGVVTVLARPSHCGERRGKEGVGVAVSDVGGGDINDKEEGWLASGAGIS